MRVLLVEDDSATAARIGKLAGVEMIVTGSVTDLQSTLAVNCRLIDVSTARVFGAAIRKSRSVTFTLLLPVAAPDVAASSAPQTPPPTTTAATVTRSPCANCTDLESAREAVFLSLN